MARQKGADIKDKSEMSNRTIEIDSIDLAAFLVTAGYTPAIYRKSDPHNSLLDGMQRQPPYKDIYALARDRVIAYTATLPNLGMIAA